MNRMTGFWMALLVGLSSKAQIDTINTQTNKLNVAALKQGKATYAVYFEDSTGNRISSADIWDRTLRLSTDGAGQKIYEFDWQVYRKDSLAASVRATGQFPSFEPLSHHADYPGRGRLSFSFANNIVTVPVDKRRTARDSAFHVALDVAAFEFPMDLELFSLLPFRKKGQQFAVAFYEPGSQAARYYPLTVTGKEDLPLTGGQKAACWLLRIDYAPNLFATFWISDKTREVLKMKEFAKGKYRYKVRLY
ncbi:MAG TPA: hypothetical protein VFT06_13055 [Flavisolibacter sp.]|nr:hypothetical protein [Flavisolibacter sp.]